MAGAADEAVSSLELDLALLVEEGDEALDLGHHLGADAVTGQEQKRMRGHGAPQGGCYRVRPIASLAGGGMCKRSQAAVRTAVEGGG